MSRWNKIRATAQSVLDMIGNTPLVRLRNIGNTEGFIAVKAEFTNPSGSHKDRIYLRMIEEAEKRGDLLKGMTIIECSTGNAGTACTMIGTLKGYNVIVVMPEGMSEERKKLIRAYGGSIIFTPGAESDQDLSMRKIEEMLEREKKHEYYYPNQFDNPDNVLAHYESTGPEIWDQSEGKVDIFLAATGSGATLTGVGRYLREQNPSVKLFAVEPAECPMLTKRRWGSHEIQGIGDGFVPRNLDLSLINGVIVTSSEESLEMARRLAREEGLLVGVSSGCNVAAALKIRKAYPNARIITMANDSGQRYFSSPLFGVEKHIEIPLP
jgi:cysteine synthase A